MYHLRIKSGFLHGLGTKAISHFNEYVSSVVQLSLKSIGSYFGGMAQLYDQVQLIKGCSIGAMAKARAFAMAPPTITFSARGSRRS
jgi:hypothetical protein